MANIPTSGVSNNLKSLIRETIKPPKTKPLGLSLTMINKYPVIVIVLIKTPAMVKTGFWVMNDITNSTASNIKYCEINKSHVSLPCSGEIVNSS